MCLAMVSVAAAEFLHGCCRPNITHAISTCASRINMSTCWCLREGVSKRIGMAEVVSPQDRICGRVFCVRDWGRSEGLEYYLGYLRATTNTPPRFMAEPWSGKPKWVMDEETRKDTRQGCKRRTMHHSTINQMELKTEDPKRQTSSRNRSPSSIQKPYRT